MTNDELRIKIAELKFERVEIRGCVRDPECGELYEVQDMDRRYSEDRSGGERYKLWPCRFDSSFSDDDLGYVEMWEPVPDWPNDIAAAWELVEEMVDGNMSLKLEDTGGSVPDRYTFQLRKRGSSLFLVRTFAPTAPLAICLAWLAWKEAQG